MALLLFLTARAYELCAPQEATTAIGGGSTAPNSEAAQISTSMTTAPEVVTSAANTTGVAGGAGSETVSPQQQLRQLILQLKDTEAPLVGPRLHPTKASAYRDFFLEEDLFGFGFDANVTLEGTIIEFLQVLSSQNPNNPFRQNVALLSRPTVQSQTPVQAQAQAQATANPSQPAEANQADNSVAAGVNSASDVMVEQWSTLYMSGRRIMLRRLVLNNPYVDYINQRNDLNNEAKWELWSNLFIKGNQWEVSTSGSSLNVDDPDSESEEEDTENEQTRIRQFERKDLKYLSQIFNEFSEFASVLSLLRNWVMNTSSGEERLWSSRFMFPHGSSFLYPDLSATNLHITSNFMSGSGQTLFTFLQRSVFNPAAGISGKAGVDTNTINDGQAANASWSVVLADGQKATALQLQAFVGRELCRRFFAPNPIEACARRISGPYLAEETFVENYLRRFGHTLNTKAGTNKFYVEKAKRKDKWPQTSFVNYSLKHTNYCPVRAHRVFGQTLEDFANILSMGLNTQELFQALGQISLLNFMVYGLEQSKGALAVGGGKANKCDINIIPVVNRSKQDRIRKCSVERCLANHELNTTAMPLYFKSHLKNLVKQAAPQLLRARSLSVAQITELFDYIRELFTFNSRGLHYMQLFVLQCVRKKRKSASASSDNFSLSGAELGAFKRRMRTTALGEGFDREELAQLNVTYNEIVEFCLHYMQQQDRSVVDYHRKLGRSIGLITTDLTVGHCYILSDELLRTLVMAVVGRSSHMALSQFLERLDQRYHIVIGPVEAKKYYAKGGPYFGSLRLLEMDDEFTKNARALREQLLRLGLLLPLSDYCDFVKNPFYHPDSAPQIAVPVAAAAAVANTNAAATAAPAPAPVSSQ